MTDLKTFLQFLRAERDAKLRALDGPIRDAQIEDQAKLPPLAAARRRLLDLPETIKDGDRSALVKQWPADFPPLPLWFTDPAAAALADPLGPPCVVSCSEPTEMLAARLGRST